MTTSATLMVSAADAKAYMDAGRPYAHRTTMSLEAELAAPPLPMIHYEGDPSELTGTLWARCELVLRINDAAAGGQPLDAGLADVG